MGKIKQIIKKCTTKTMQGYISLISKFLRNNKSIYKTSFFGLKLLFKAYTPSKKHIRGKQIRKLLNRVEIKIDQSNKFIYNIDVYKMLYKSEKVTIENTTIDYSKILNNSLNDFKKNNELLEICMYKESQSEVILGIEEYIDRECKKVEKSNRDDKEKIIGYLQAIKDKKAKSFEEAIQRILFFNQITWQIGQNLNGLGRLDKILDSYYKNDLKNNIITKEDAKEKIKEMCKILHKYYWYKSNSLIGDTGQIIILGGKEEDGSYFCNDLTYLFIDVIKELQIPDPKVLLRVSSKVPRDLMEVSLNCIKTGIGCPLFSNDDVIINKLIDFGYEKEDAYNYVTSACWEPLIAGKSVEQNNIDCFIYAIPLTKMMDNEQLDKLDSYNKFIDKYKDYLKQYTADFIEKSNKINWEAAPFLSMLTEGCNKNLADVSTGGAKYNSYGFTSVSLGNVVNSIYNIKKYVYEENEYTLEEINNIRKNNYAENEEILRKFKQQPNRYGTDNEEIIKLTNEITNYVDSELKTKKSKWGGKIKIGFSAPSYVEIAKNIKATFEGRKNFEPFEVHISSDKPGEAYTELIQFATKLDYSNHRFNRKCN